MRKWRGNSSYQTPWKLKRKFAIEGYFFKKIRESRFLTTDPAKAHLFFIPVSCHKMRGKLLLQTRLPLSRTMLSLILKYPYLNRTQGADHFFVTCYDIGVRATEGFHNLWKNSIRVLCSRHKGVSLPQIIPPFLLYAGGNDFEDRTSLALWTGYSNYSKLKDLLAQFWQNDERQILSKFCICPGGSLGNFAQIVDSIHCGCVPVIISDFHDLPFNDILDWNKLSMIIREDDVHRLNLILKGIISKGKFINSHKNTFKAQKQFEWNTPPIKYGTTFHMVVYELWLRRYFLKYRLS
ncbi:exostosin domain-containing protein [Citrus sinensis]|nr:exostosin domain-containing protein [Citrus sinensis]